ncbi:MAG: ABC transporter permease [Candidatus Thorarchaeota archaeon]
MSLRILFLDELKGFYKSKVMIILWIGIPLLSLLLHFIPNTEDFPITSLVAILIASIGGTLAAAMLSTSIASEKSRHVYDLFLIRPVRRSSILLAKFFAVYLCLIIATGISLMLGFIVDRITIGILPKDILVQTFESLFISLAGMAISCSIGMLFGILVSSVPVAAILSVYLGNQLTALSILPTVFLDFINPILFALIIGISVSTCILTISILTFNRREF